jgi:hypothetical protein
LNPQGLQDAAGVYSYIGDSNTSISNSSTCVIHYKNTVWTCYLLSMLKEVYFATLATATKNNTISEEK